MTKPPLSLVHITIRPGRHCNSCKRLWTSIPASARLLESDDLLSGYYWECSCNSTLFEPLSNLPPCEHSVLHKPEGYTRNLVCSQCGLEIEPEGL